jgi:hypothetical protein
VAIVIFGVGQLVLPSLAEHIVRQRLAKDGKVLSVSISAFPAIELLFGDADTVNVKMASYRASESQVAKNIGQSSGVTNVNLTANTVSSGGLTIDSVTMTKRGDHFTGTGRVTEASIRSAVPEIDSVTPVSSSDGAVTLQVTGTVPFIGTRITGDAKVSAAGGTVNMSGVGLLSFLKLTVWSNPRVYVESLSGKTAIQGISLSAKWRLG